MAAQIDELILDHFRVGDDDFRDLDSIVRRQCDAVTYYVNKGSSVEGYDTSDVEELLKDRNGTGTRIRSVRLHATGPEGLRFNVEFNEAVVVNGECEERGRLAVLATDARSVIQDRMKAGIRNRSNILWGVAALLAILGYFGFQAVQNSNENKFYAIQNAQEGRISAPYTHDLKALDSSTQALLSQSEAALARHNIQDEVAALLRQQIDSLQQQTIGNRENQATNRSYAQPPWWESSGIFLLIVTAAIVGIGTGIAHLVVPSNKSVFMVGDEKGRQKRADKLRHDFIWGILVALAISLAAGAILSKL